MTDDLAMSSRYLKQQMKKDLEVAMVVLRGGNTYRPKLKQSGVLAPVHILEWEMPDRLAAEIWEHPESNRSDFKANSVANRKPMQIRKEQV